MDNADIARVLDEVADLLDILGENQFRVRAYRTAARTVETFAEAAGKIVLRDPKELCELAGIGRDLAGKIAEMVTTGDLALRRELVAKVPAGVATMMRVAGIGPKRAKLFYEKLGIRALDELEVAAKARRLRGIRGVGEVLEKRILKGCAEQRARTARFTISEADAHATPLLAYLRASPAVEVVGVAGSLRRRRETIGDIDLLVASRDPRSVAELFVRYPEITNILAHGETNPRVNVLAHPTGRLLGRREPSALDLAKVVASAKDHGVFLELDAQPNRLDLSDTLVRMARDAGARIVIDTDAHRVAELEFMRYGVDQARRGWCTASGVANTLQLASFRALMRREPSAIRERAFTAKGFHAALPGRRIAPARCHAVASSARLPR